MLRGLLLSTWLHFWICTLYSTTFCMPLYFFYSSSLFVTTEVILPSTGHWSNLVHFALVYTNLSAIQFYMNTSLLVASCESKVFHIWHKDMAAAEPACPVQAGIYYIILVNINLYIHYIEDNFLKCIGWHFWALQLKWHMSVCRH